MCGQGGVISHEGVKLSLADEVGKQAVKAHFIEKILFCGSGELVDGPVVELLEVFQVLQFEGLAHVG